MPDPIRDVLESPLDQAPSRPGGWVWTAVAVGVTGLLIGAVVLLRGDPPVVDASGSSTTTTTLATVSTAAVLVLDDPEVFAGVIGPKPAFEPTGLGTHEPLTPQEDVSLAERGWIGQIGYDADHPPGPVGGFIPMLAIVREKVTAVGMLPPNGRILLAEGVSSRPNLPGFGGPAACIRAQTPSFGARQECFAFDPDISARPAFVGEGIVQLLDIVAWTHLPPETSVAVLAVNGTDRSWLRPVSGVAAFSYQLQIGDRARLRMLDASGAEIGVADRAIPLPPTGVHVEPLIGYADFSGRTFDTITELEIADAVVACLIDNGVAAEVFLPRHGDMINDGVLVQGDGEPIPGRGWVWVLESGQAADLMHARCRAGLALPPEPHPGSDDRETYDELASIGSCLLALGDEEMTQAPSFEDWVSSDPDTRWHPWVARTALLPEGAEECFG